MKHTDIRAAVLDALELHEHGATLFDGRPVVFDEEDFPAVAVYLTDAEYTGEELDSWMESRIYPAMSAIPALAGMITTMVQQGYDYRRDDDMALWSSADLTYSITYEM
ncbi:TPA: phage tail protein [Escherichia coli]|uniref:phage tail terminator protein n=1 Tax=Escherichia coli TaxID=562 RepID=UPI0006A11C06|nr:phage tail terminator protein [Escherichia coli]CTT01297.1 phage minor tail protein [Escherichia coli]CTT28476.1 phage minor tail protein [Escherichia coli]CTT82113.1 phage minor tail protein [Escherichia coli]HBP8558772.1 phage tail protein [Escherichia coli]